MVQEFQHGLAGSYTLWFLTRLKSMCHPRIYGVIRSFDWEMICFHIHSMVVGSIQFPITKELDSSLVVCQGPPSSPCHMGLFVLVACFIKAKKATTSVSKTERTSLL